MIMRQMSRTVSFFFQLPHPPALTSSPRDSSPLNLRPPSSVAPQLNAFRVSSIETRMVYTHVPVRARQSLLLVSGMSSYELRRPPRPASKTTFWREAF